MTPEDEQYRRDEARKAADEAETKPIRQLVEDIHYESITGDEKTTVPLVRTTARFACLLYRLSIESEKQTRKVVRLTRWLIVLTIALVLLTTGLLGFTIYLAQNAYLNRQRSKTVQHHEPEPDQTNFKAHTPR